MTSLPQQHDLVTQKHHHPISLRQKIRKMIQRYDRVSVRLTLLFGLVVFIGVTTTAFINALITWYQVRDFPVVNMSDMFTAPDGVTDILGEYYEKQGSWEGVEIILNVVQATSPVQDGLSITYRLVSSQGHIIYSNHPVDWDEWQYQQRYSEMPVTVNGEIIAEFDVLLLNNYAEFTPGSRPTIGSLFTGWLADSFWRLILVGTVVGILFGILVSRPLTAPLRNLITAANEIGQWNLSQRVEVKGTQEIRQLAAAFNDMATDLERAENLRLNLVSDVAHELRTPLSVLQGNLRALLDGVYPLKQEEIARLYDQTRLLSRLVNDLHELSQAEAKKLPFHMDAIDLVDVVRHVAGIFEPIANERQVQLQLQTDDSLPIEGDSTRLHQALNNLLSNALRHTPAGGKISLLANTEGTHITLQVRDTGRGIPPEHLPNIFERFYRAQQSRSRYSGGAGLGLAITHAIILAHDGTITVDSKGIPRQGTVFTVSLPLRPTN